MLQAHISLMCALLLYREPTLLFEEPVLSDAASQIQIAHLLDPLQRSDNVSRNSSPSGAGAITRVQMLLFVNELCDRAAAVRARRMKPWLPGMMDSRRQSQPCLLRVQRLLLLRLVSIFSTPDWQLNLDGSDAAAGMPGSSLHGTKLRIMQAVCILGGRWGEVSDVEGCSMTGSPECTAGLFFAPEWSTCSEAVGRIEIADPGVSSSGGDPPATWLYSLANDLYIQFPFVGAAEKNTFSGHCEFSRPVVARSVVTEKKRSSGSKPKRLVIKLSDRFPLIPEALRGSNPADLNESDAKSDVSAAAAVIAILARYALGANQLPSTRQYMETLMMALARRYPEAALSVYIEPFLKDFTVRYRYL